MRFKLLPSFALLLLIAGCATVTPEERRAADEAECHSYGFRPGTDAFAECLQRIELDRRAEWRARRASLDRWPTPVIYRTVVVARD